MRMLFFAHSGLRYLVLLAAIAALAYCAYAMFTKEGNQRVARALGSAFVGLLDLQILLGLAMVVLGAYYPALIGHLFMMVAAAVVAHFSLVLGRSAESAQKGYAIRLLGIAIALALIIAGISAIGRSVFGSGAPSFV